MNMRLPGLKLVIAALLPTLAVYAAGDAHGSAWEEVDKFHAFSPSMASGFGYTIDIDGQVAVIGAHGGDQSLPFGPGAAYVFVRDSNGEWLEEARLVASGDTSNNDFGEGVAVSGDTVLVGAFRTSPYGAAFIFERDAAGYWQETLKLTPSDNTLAGQFGRRVALDGDIAAIGSLAAWNVTGRGGAVYIFERDSGGNWAEVAKLFPDDVQAGDEFGGALELVGNVLVVGAEQSDPGGSASGSAYVFARSPSGVWQQQQKLTSLDLSANDFFGNSVSFDGQTIVVGAILDDDSFVDSGSAYVFEPGVSGWEQVGKLTASDAGVSDIFGYRSAVSGDSMVVTAAYADGQSSNNGAAYWFQRGVDGTWSEVQKLIPSGDRSGLHFGTNVALSDRVALISTGLSSGGQVYSFEKPVTDYPVEFDVQDYAGSWALIDHADGSQLFNGVGAQIIELEPGSYRIGIGESQVLVDLQSDGDVIPANEDAFTGGNLLLQFNTVPLTVDPQLYSGPWAVRRGVHDGSAGGSQAFALVAALEYDFGVAESAFGFHVDATGFVSEASAAANGAQNLLELVNSPLYVDVGLYDGTWSLTRGIFSSSGGNASLVLVPGIDYGMNIGTSGTFQFSISGDDLVSVPNGISAGGGFNTLSFSNELINVNPGTYLLAWHVQGVLVSSGISDLIVVPGVDYIINNGYAQEFSVTTPCAVDPTSFLLGSDVFTITCGPSDSDADGVPTVSDNCPDDANPDQVDQDLDGLGNACDEDLDGDGIINDADNCPDFENASQEDLDGDGIGDVCDDDRDQDSVNNAVDNCPHVANTDQGDNDLDGLGDACDVDDDNDDVADGLDNCPLNANPDQADFNQNGQGDVCDGDVDGDGVSNDVDLCDLSPQSSPVNVHGCTGSQYISLQCDADDYVQHGQYVSCVALAANEAVDQGLITPEEKARFIREAAKSN